MVHELSKYFSLVSVYVSQLREVGVQQDRQRFRRNMERIGEIAAVEISRILPTVKRQIQTPLDGISAEFLAAQPVVVTILRAGIPLFNGLMNYFDEADAGFVAAYRKHDANDYFTIQQDYLTSPSIQGRPLILADPMLATGASLHEALKDLLTLGDPSSVHIVSAIASRQGIDFIQEKYPDFHLWIGAIDPNLTPKGYITPGLGDAGDLSFGKKLQQ